MALRGIAVLALPGCRFSGVAAMLDLCRLSNVYTQALFAEQEGPRGAMRALVLTPDGGPVRFADGRTMKADGTAGEPDQMAAVYVASFEPKAGDMARWLATQRALCKWLRAQHTGGAKLAGAGAGVLLLAEAGVLEGGEAAAAVEFASVMQRRFPRVRCDGVGALAHWGGVHTASAIGAEPSLATRLLEDVFSRNLGDHLTKITQISDEGFGAEQAHAAPLDEDEIVRRAQTWLQQRFTQQVSIPELASALALSLKGLTRRFKKRLGVTPKRYLVHLRMETAKRQLMQTNRRVERIAALVGYGDVGFFKQKFREHTGLTPAAFRAAARTSRRNRES